MPLEAICGNFKSLYNIYIPYIILVSNLYLEMIKSIAVEVILPSKFKSLSFTGFYEFSLCEQCVQDSEP